MIGLLILLVSGVLTVGFCAIGLMAFRRVLRARVREGHNDVLAPIFLTGGTLYGVFLAFIVVAVWERYDAAKANIADEASALATLYRAAAATGPAGGGSLQGEIRRYAVVVVRDEWPVQAQGRITPVARGFALHAFRLIGHPQAATPDAGPTKSSELALLGEIEADANKRAIQASESFSPLMWWPAIGGGVLVIAMSFLLFGERPEPHILMSSMMAMLIWMLLAIIFVLSRPYSGLAQLKPEPFVKLAAVFDAIDRTP